MKYPILHFREPIDEAEWEFVRGFYDGIIVEVENGFRYSVYFYEPVRLSQDLQSELEAEKVDAKWGRNYIAEVGMIVVSEITMANMRKAIERLYSEGWFNSFQPIKEYSS